MMHVPSSTVAVESKLTATGDMHPGTRYVQQSGVHGVFALEAKLCAVLSVQPKTG